MSNTEIWTENGDLIPLEDIHYSGDNNKDVAVVIVNRDRPDLTDKLVEQLEEAKGHLNIDIFVIEMGSTKPSKYASFHYDDPDFRGKAYGHNVGLRYAKHRGCYSYYFTIMNDIEFLTPKALEVLVGFADQHKNIGIWSPTEPRAGYAGGVCKPVKGQHFHLVSQVNYLALLIKGELIDDGVYLNPDFKYCWGAIHELSYILYSLSLGVAYCGSVQMLHYGSSTYGQVANTPSRKEYLQNAQKFAARYMVEHYGKEWDKVFSRVLPKEVMFNTYTKHRRKWELQLSERERKSYNTIVNKGTLEGKIEALNPWYYPVNIKGIDVIPGLGSKQSPESLIERAKFRKKILVDEVSKLYDFKGRTIIDVACNCGYWSSYYARLGASHIVGIEGRLDYVEQARLYWDSNDFGEHHHLFIHGNVLSPEVWKYGIKEYKYDFALCAGILYHIPDPELLLIRLCDKADTILVDTRVAQRDGEPIQELGGWHFDSISVTSKKKIPTKEGIIKILRTYGFLNIEEIIIDDPVPEGMKGKDNYNTRNRITLLAKRQ